MARVTRRSARFTDESTNNDGASRSEFVNASSSSSSMGDSDSENRPIVNESMASKSSVVDDAPPHDAAGVRRSTRLSLRSTETSLSSNEKGKQKVIYKEDSTDFEENETDDASTSAKPKKRTRRSFSEDVDDDSGSDFELDDVSSTSSDNAKDEEEQNFGEETANHSRMATATSSPIATTSSSNQASNNAIPIGRRGRRSKPSTGATVDQAISVDDDEILDDTIETPAVMKKKKQKIPDLHVLHPELEGVWDQLKSEVSEEDDKTIRANQPEDVNVKLLPFQLEGLHWLMKQEEGRFAGGILADEMGMGKTIQMISLLVSRRDIKPNLILCPTVAIMQWMAELTNRTTPGLFNILLFHGNNRPKRLKEIEPYDIVLSTYSIVEQGYRKQTYGTKRQGELVKERSILHTIEWGRVVLDEAHAIKDRSCSTARAVFALKRKYQWSLSGTPLQNRVGELYSIIRFLNADPFSFYFCRSCDCKLQTWKFSDRTYCDECGHSTHRHFCWWNAEILKPIQKYGAAGDGLVAFRKLGLLLDRIMLRRTKVERTEELGLPPRIVTARTDVFNAAEEELYESLYSDTSRTFSTYVAAGTVLNNYASIFSLLSRMRLAANHPDLVTTRLALESNTATERLVCGICQEQAEDPILSQCKHVFCREDARQFIQSAPSTDHPKCPVCFKKLNIDLTQPEMERKDGEGSSNAIQSSIVNYIDLANWRSSTKIEALVEELSRLHNEDHTIKSIVFSQFVSFLDLIQWRLSRAGFQVVKLDGRMGPAQRDTVIKKFMTDPYVTVFLVSLKAGGVALNLTEASHVFIMDPWWNPAVEDQAFDRIHRLGQYRPIKITRLIIENSIESRILQLQEKKKALFESTVGKDMDALAKLTEDDLRFLFVL